jgi:hypothetical protein
MKKVGKKGKEASRRWPPPYILIILARPTNIFSQE